MISNDELRIVMEAARPIPPRDRSEFPLHHAWLRIVWFPRAGVGASWNII